MATTERQFLTDVTEALHAAGREYRYGLTTATELTAAAFSVSSIRQAWGARVPALVRSLRGIFQRSANRAERDTGGTLPDTWDGLQRRDEAQLPQPVREWERATTGLLMLTGDDMARVADQELREGLAAGESPRELRRRLEAVFSPNGDQLGPVRARRIAATETTRAWNAAQLGAAREMTGLDRPLVKQWLTESDSRVRLTHRDANGQLRHLDETFQVGVSAMMYPGDPTAPPDETVACRCRLGLA